jgi:UDP-GlcNAc:undecaprenyl-phosphate GlcNAc-1-phosphate transferase
MYPYNLPMSLTLSQLIILGTAGFAMSGILTGPMRRFAIRLGALDIPTVARKTQVEPVPYLGGVSIAITICVITFTSLLVSNATTSSFFLASHALLPALLMGIMGLVDDLVGLNPFLRLAMQTFAGSIAAIFLIKVGTLGLVFSYQYINVLITILWIVGICNSINFFDNLDGGAAGTVAISTFGISVIAFLEGQNLISALAIITTGATLGFLLWNKSPAKIYMGDSGALFLGVLLAVLTIRLDPESTSNWKALFIPVLLLAVPILDTCIAVFSRLQRGISPLQGGQDHLSHRLVRKGMQRKSAAITLWVLSVIFCLFAVSIYLWSETIGTPLIIVASSFWLFLFTWFWRIPSEG